MGEGKTPRSSSLSTGVECHRKEIIIITRLGFPRTAGEFSHSGESCFLECLEAGDPRVPFPARTGGTVEIFHSGIRKFYMEVLSMIHCI